MNSGTSLFVVNVNRDADGLKVNVNKFSNDNVWNGKNRNRVVVPAKNIFLLVIYGEFLFSVQVRVASHQAFCQFQQEELKQ
jgi:hypothetical protein